MNSTGTAPPIRAPPHFILLFDSILTIFNINNDNSVLLHFVQENQSEVLQSLVNEYKQREHHHKGDNKKN